MELNLSEELGSAFARIALGHVRREYPNKLDHVLSGPADLRSPRDLHPVFYGSYDWHSCVHSYWALAYLLQRFPQMQPAAEIRALFDAQLAPDKVAAECAYVRFSALPGFERPYGWAWLLKLVEELHQHGEEPWLSALTPIAALFRVRFHEWLAKATYPVRTGTHSNTAFALVMATDYASATYDCEFAAMLRAKAVSWYGQDMDCQAWEPSGEDFLSPALIEAECMRRLLLPDQFLTWFGAFLPRLAGGQPETLFRPAAVSDRADGAIVHLDGLNLSRAWCWRMIASAFPQDDPRTEQAVQAAADHLTSSLPQIAGHYMGRHWLATFALLAMGS
jgi:Protein of unknown function (DUF2891)